MNNKLSKIINLVLIILVIILAFQIPSKNDVKEATSTKSTLDIIHERKSVRHFTDRVVTTDELTTLIKAGMAAPTAVNKQPWQFLVIDDKAIISAIAETNRNKDHYLSCSALIVVCGDTTRTLEGAAQDYWVQDCSAATQNILLAAESMGLGALWTGVYPLQERVDITKSTLSLPEYIIPLCIIAVGEPTGEDKPKDKWKPELMHYNVW